MIEDERFVLDLVQDHKIKLMKIITSRLGQCRTADVEDCFQDIFMLAFINREKLKTHPNPVGWLYVTASNVAYDARRRNLKHEQLTVSFSDVMEYLGEDGVDIAELHSEARLQKQRMDDVVPNGRRIDLADAAVPCQHKQTSFGAAVPRASNKRAPHRANVIARPVLQLSPGARRTVSGFSSQMPLAVRASGKPCHGSMHT